MKINMMQLSKFISWSVCGDGYVGYAAHNKNCHYSISRDPVHKDYLQVVSSKFDGLQDCKVVFDDYLRKDNNKSVSEVRTTSHPIFSRIRERQYMNNRRVIDPHQLTLLDWEAAAFLYMDDGSLCFNNKGSQIVRLSTCAYTWAEQLQLRQAFVEKLGVVWNVNRTGKNLWQLNLSHNSKEKWFDGIREYIVPSYEYKLPESLQKVASRTDDDLVYLITEQGQPR
jgi:hypothetical protein